MENKSYYIESLGCAKNQVDSEMIMAELERGGFSRAASPEDAALIVVNTCSFIESAKRESIETILSFKKLYPDKKLSVRGCLFERYKDELAGLLPEVDEFSGVPENKSFFDDAAGGAASRPLLSLPGTAYIKISEGCNNRCSFCAIPLIKGNLRSRSIASIKSEAASLLKRGVKELVLIAQDSGSFGMDKGRSMLSDLLYEIALLSNDFWLRLLYIHPDNLIDGALLENLINLMKNDRRFLPYFDIPFQHASPAILSSMGRRGRAESYLEVIKKIRAELPFAAIRSTFLTGFPGETDEDFALLERFQQKACFDWLGVFTYSREEGTKAYSMKNRPSKKLSSLRRQKLEDAQELLSAERMKLFLGLKTTALIEEEIELESGDGLLTYIGRLPIHAPEVDGAALIESAFPVNAGSFVKVQTLKTAGIDIKCKSYE